MPVQACFCCKCTASNLNILLIQNAVDRALQPVDILDHCWLDTIIGVENIQGPESVQRCVLKFSLCVCVCVCVCVRVCVCVCVRVLQKVLKFSVYSRRGDAKGKSCFVKYPPPHMYPPPHKYPPPHM